MAKNSQDSSIVSSLIANILRDIQKNPQNIPLACALSLATDLGSTALAIAGMAVTKPALNRARELLNPPLKSNHLLLQLVHECKWKAVHVITLEIHLDKGVKLNFRNEKLLKEIHEIADYWQKQKIHKSLDARDHALPAKPTYFESCVNMLIGTADREKRQFSSYSETDQQIYEELAQHLGREPHYQAGDSGERAKDLYDISAQASGELLLNEIYRRIFRGGNREQHDFHSKRKYNDNLNHFMTVFEDQKIGWAATFRCLLNQKLCENKNGEATQVLINFGSESINIELDTNSLVRGLDERLASLTDILQCLGDHVNQLKNYVQPTLRLDPNGGDTTTGRTRFIDYVYSAQRTTFLGRDGELSDLTEFLYSSELLSWWQIAGDSGQGKSRLALELVQKAERLGWHAGFLRSEELRAVNDWATLPIDRPTLCVVDYVAAPQKAILIAKALVTMFKRQSEEHRDWDTPNLQNFRLLVIERTPYYFDDYAGQRSTEGRALWFNFFTSTGNLGAISDTAFARSALELNDLSTSDMLAIAQSWRVDQNKTCLSKTQASQLKQLLERPDSTDKSRKRAWRPLIAMVMADTIAGRNDEESLTLSETLKCVLEEEANRSWQDADGQTREPTIGARRLAALATILSSLDSRSVPLDKTFYELGSEKVLDDAWMTLGYRVTGGARFERPPPLIARTPDLLGEYMVHWLILEEADHEKIMVDAWSIDANATLSFLIRLSEDYRDIGASNTFKSLASVAPTQHIDMSIQESDLNYAAFYGLTGLAINLLNRNVDPNFSDSSGIFPLLMAAQEGCVDVVVALLRDPRIEVNKVEPIKGPTPLLMAVQNGHIDVVAALLNHPSIQVNRESRKDGTFPLLMATQQAHVDVVSILLKQPRIEVNQDNKKNGVFPLLTAAEKGYADLVCLLLKQPGIEVNKENGKTGTFPLFMAAQEGHIEVVAALLEHPRINVNKVDSIGGAFPLLMAAQCGHADVVAALLKRQDIDVNQENDKNGTFPLLMAAQCGHADVVAALLKHQDIDVNQENDKNGTFPLLIAAQKAHIEVVTALLKQPGIEINKSHRENRIFPLLLAAEEGYADVVAALLKHDGIQANKVHPIDGRFPLLMAAQEGHIDVVAALLKHTGIEVNKESRENGMFPLLAAAQSGHVDVVISLLEQPVIEVNKVDPQRATFPLLMAAQEGHVAVVAELLEQHDIGVNQENKKSGTFPLLMAAERGHADVVALLLEQRGIEVNRENSKHGAFPLLLATQRGHVDVVTALLERPDIEVNQEHRDTGEFPLLMAVGYGHVAIIRLLFDHRADLQQIWRQKNSNVIELCLETLAEDGTNEERALCHQCASVMLQLGATLRDGSVPELPALEQAGA